MLLKSIVLFLVIVAVQSATLQGRNIPVEVRYERLHHDINSNLVAKVQLSPEELQENQLRLQKFSYTEEDLHTPTKDHSYLNKNLDEKVQLSPEELLQLTKHIPIHQSVKEDQENNGLEKFGEIRAGLIPSSSSVEHASRNSLFQQAEDTIQRGLKNLRNNFRPKGNELVPPKELWDKLEKDVREYLSEEKNKFGSRQNQGTDQQNIFQNFANGFQQLTNNFIQQFQGTNQNPQNGTSGDEGTAPQQQGPIQGFIGYFTGGVQNIVSNIQNLGQNGQQTSGNSTILGDTGTGQQPPNIIGSFVNGVQQFFQGPQQGINQVLTGNNTQGDTGTANPGGVQQGFFAGAISQFNQVVSNIIPTSQAPPAAQGDEGTTPASQGGNPGGNPIQQVIQSFGNIGTAFNQFIQGGQQNRPQGSEDENSSQPPNQNFIQSIGQNLGNAFQNIQNQFRPPAAVAGGNTQQPAGGASNPIVGQVSNIGNQIQQVAGQAVGSNPIQNLIPGSSSESSGKNPAAAQSESAPEKPVNEEVGTKNESEKKEVMTAME